MLASSISSSGLLVEGCSSAPSKDEGRSTLAGPLDATPGSEYAHHFGIQSWQVYVGSHANVVVTGFDQTGHPVRGVQIAPFSATPTVPAHIRLEMLDGTGAAIRRSANGEVSGSLSEAQWEFFLVMMYDFRPAAGGAGGLGIRGFSGGGLRALGLSNGQCDGESWHDTVQNGGWCFLDLTVRWEIQGLLSAVSNLNNLFGKTGGIGSYVGGIVGDMAQPILQDCPKFAEALKPCVQCAVDPNGCWEPDVTRVDCGSAGGQTSYSMDFCPDVGTADDAATESGTNAVTESGASTEGGANAAAEAGLDGPGSPEAGSGGDGSSGADGGGNGDSDGGLAADWNDLGNLAGSPSCAPNGGDLIVDPQNGGVSCGTSGDDRGSPADPGATLDGATSSSEAGYAFVREARSSGRHHAMRLPRGESTTLRFTWNDAPGVAPAIDLGVEIGDRTAVQIFSLGGKPFVHDGVEVLPLDAAAKYRLVLTRGDEAIRVQLLPEDSQRALVDLRVGASDDVAADVVLPGALWRSSITSDDLD